VCVTDIVLLGKRNAVVMANIVLCDVRALSEEIIFVIETSCIQSEVGSEAGETAEH
jgi:hypothetical protein